MSRISRYKESIEKFFKTKSFINDIDISYKNQIIELSTQTDYFVSIILLTVMNNISKKHNLSLHAYFMASGVEALYMYNNIVDNKIFYGNTIGTPLVDNLKMIIYNNIYRSLSQNIDSISSHIKTEKLIKINTYSTKYITTNLEILMSHIQPPLNVWVNNDVIKFKSFDQTKLNKIMSLKCYSHDELLSYIDKNLGSICKIALVSGWLLGNGDEKNVIGLEKLSICMARMFKIAYDYYNLINDLNKCVDFTYNSVISLGFQTTFSIFQDNRAKFIEGCMVLDIYTNTVKEIIDVLESRMDLSIDNTLTSHSE